MAVLVATGWWAVKTFWLVAPLPAERMVSYGEFSPPSSNVPPGPPVAATRKSIGMVYKVGGDVTVPIPIYKPEPDYTKEARAAKLEGTDMFWIVVDATGNVADVKLLRGFDKGLDENAMRTLRKWEFEPARRNGRPVPVELAVETSFKLF